jgi:uncharacterized protein YjbJ (UPF0337 family)
MNKDRLKGTIKVSAGKLQAKLGEITGNTRQEAKGLSKEIEGKVQRSYGDAKQSVKDVLKKV